MSTTTPLTEAEALERVVRLLRAAGYADTLLPFLADPIDAFRRAPEHFVYRDPTHTVAAAEEALGALAALIALRAGYGVTPPARDEEPHDPPPRG